MLESIYPVSFIIALAGILIWSSWSENKSVATFGRILLLTGMVSWISSIVLSTTEWDDKLWIIARDLMVIGMGSTLAMWTRSNRMVNLLLLMSIGFFLKMSYIPILENTFRTVEDHLDPKGEWLVEINAEKLTEARLAFSEKGVTLLSPFDPADADITDLDDIYTVDLPNTWSIADRLDLRTYLTSEDLVAWIEENEVIEVSDRTMSLTNDPDIDKLWSFKTFDVTSLYQVLNSPLVRPKKQALVAILDTGVDSKHEDLAANYVSTNNKYDRDVKGHGTHCAGILGAVSNNKVGIASFAPDQGFFQITSIKVLSDLGFGSQGTTIKGMIEAADLGADVISMSLGAPSTDERQRAYGEAVKYCLDKGTIVVVAGGNSSTNAIHYSPANTPGVIAVAAIDENHNKAHFSNTMEDIRYAVAAPGKDIYSTYPGDKYKNLSGTSMATPYVASLVAIMKSISPDITVSQVHTILDGTGIPTNDTKLTGKIIQPAEAVRALLD